MTESEPEFDLKKSIEKFGVLVPVIKDQDGNTLDGIHRLELDANAPVHTIKVKDIAQRAMIRLIINLDRRNLKKPEKQMLLGEIADSFRDKDDKVDTQAIADALGKTQSWVLEFLPEQYKDQTKVEAGKASGQARKVFASDEQTVTIQDTVECDRCHVSTTQPTQWHNHNLCEACLPKAQLNPESFDGYFRYADRKSEPKPLLKTDFSKPLEKWEDRKAHMSSQHSKMEGNIIASLIDSGVHGIIQDRHFCVLETIPDIYIPAQNLAIYLDGEVHNGKEDRDEKLRELLTKRHSVKVLSYKYDSTSQKEIERVTHLILENLGIDGAKL